MKGQSPLTTQEFLLLLAFWFELLIRQILDLIGFTLLHQYFFQNKDFSEEKHISLV